MEGEERLSFARAAPDTLLVRLSGVWRLHRNMPSPALIRRELESAGKARRVVFEASGLGHWDSALVAFLLQVDELCKRQGIAVDRGGLPAGVRRMLELAEAVPERQGARARLLSPGFVERVGLATISAAEGVGEFFSFLGEVTIAFGRLFVGKARVQGSDMVAMMETCGWQALGIVLLISYLVGVILAFMGAVQLQQFGASIYVADLVGIGITREMGAMMTAIIMAGRTGAAFAAQLGTMKVRQEIDALTTLGVSPVEFLVLPRVLALVLMMPLLCLYSDFVGVLGGATIGIGMLNLSLVTYLRETVAAVHFGGVLGGVFKATVYGVLIAIAGCLRGFQCGGSASAVGDAATSAVVTGIVAIVGACGLFAVLFNLLGI